MRARVQNFDPDNTPRGVVIEDDAGAHLLALNDWRVAEAHGERIGIGVIARLHRFRLRLRSKKVVSTRQLPPSGTYITRRTRPSRSGSLRRVRTRSGWLGSGSVISGASTV